MKVIRHFLLFLCLFLMFETTAFAASGTLKIEYNHNVNVQIYQIATEQGITKDFQQCDINFDNYEYTVKNLLKYVKKEYIHKEMSIVDNNLSVTLDKGWYFITGDDYKKDNVVYHMSPSLVYVSTELKISPKYTTSIIPEDTPNPPEEPKDDSDKIIQTGTILWPIYYLIIVVILLFIFYLINKKPFFLIASIILLLIGIVYYYSASKEEVISNEYIEIMLPQVQQEMKTNIEENKENEEQDLDVPIYELYPDIEMPSVMIDDLEYIGILNIPDCDLELPILKECNEENLKKSPCKYSGSIYKDNMIIAGHNYKKHFTYVKKLDLGSIIYFTDANGNVFYYELVEIEIIKGTDVELLDIGEWDLTLFTCTNSGKDRSILRFVEIMKP